MSDGDDEWALLECLFYRPDFAVFLDESPVTFLKSGLTEVVWLLSRVPERPQWDWDATEPTHRSYAMFAGCLLAEALKRGLPPAKARHLTDQTMTAIKSLPRQQKYVHPDAYPLKLLEYVETGTWPDPLTPNTR